MASLGGTGLKSDLTGVALADSASCCCSAKACCFSSDLVCKGSCKVFKRDFAASASSKRDSMPAMAALRVDLSSASWL